MITHKVKLLPNDNSKKYFMLKLTKPYKVQNPPNSTHTTVFPISRQTGVMFGI